eukprot:1112455-Lingulodinium_polyedra.AAC.1
MPGYADAVLELRPQLGGIQIERAGNLLDVVVANWPGRPQREDAESLGNLEVWELGTYDGCRDGCPRRH